MNFEFAQATHMGDRPVNQDYAAHNFGKGWALFVIADGLGGHEGGELASQGFCAALIENSVLHSGAILNDPEKGFRDLIQVSIQEMSERLLELGHEDARTTAAMVWLTTDYLLSAHIGDSRVYLIDNKHIVWKTHDHSVMQQLLDSQEITAEEIPNHPSQAMLLNTISCHEVANPEIHRYPPLQVGQLLLLCTDGFWQYMSEPELESLVNATTLQQALKEVVATCVLRSQPYSDNVTVQALRLK